MHAACIAGQQTERNQLNFACIEDWQDTWCDVQWDLHLGSWIQTNIDAIAGCSMELYLAGYLFLATIFRKIADFA